MSANQKIDQQDERTKYFREAADRIWDMAVEYRQKGFIELSLELKDLASELHIEARKRETNEENSID